MRAVARAGIPGGGSGEACFLKLLKSIGGPDLHHGVAVLLVHFAGGDGGDTADEPTIAAVRTVLAGEISRNRAHRDLHDVRRSGFARWAFGESESGDRLPKQRGGGFACEEAWHAAATEVAHPDAEHPIAHDSAGPGVAKAIGRSGFA